MQIRCFDYLHTDAWDLVSTADELYMRLIPSWVFVNWLDLAPAFCAETCAFFGEETREHLFRYICVAMTHSKFRTAQVFGPVGPLFAQCKPWFPQVTHIKKSCFLCSALCVLITSQKWYEWGMWWRGMECVVCSLACVLRVLLYRIVL